MLEGVERDLAERQNRIEEAAAEWVAAKRHKEKAYATAYMLAEGPVVQRQAEATQATALNGLEAEAKYEALKAVIRVLETRASVGQTLMRSYNRLGG